MVIVSAHGRKGAFVVFCGEGGLENVVLLSIVLLAVIITFSGLAAAVVEVMEVGGAMDLTTPTEDDCGGTTGLKLDGPVLNTGTGTLVGANEMMGPAGKATLNLGRGSVAAVMLAGGDRLSGEALGGVRGAYGLPGVVTAGRAGTVTTVGMGTGVAWEALGITSWVL